MSCDEIMRLVNVVASDCQAEVGHAATEAVAYAGTD